MTPIHEPDMIRAHEDRMRNIEQDIDRLHKETREDSKTIMGKLDTVVGGFAELRAEVRNAMEAVRGLNKRVECQAEDISANRRLVIRILIILATGGAGAIGALEIFK